MGARVWRAAIGAAIAVMVTPGAIAAPVHYALPPETAALAPGPGREAAAVCGACHSVDYISTQPRGLANPQAFWAAEVAKMRKAYGAPIDEEEGKRITAYLVAAYGK